MNTNGINDNFVTIVPVGEAQPSNDDSSFVTVLSVEAIEGASEIIVQRPKGERLGLGLKFEGGSAATETVRRLLVQSCAEGSPSANAKTPWGLLIPGDEILAIDGVPVSELTRIDCVRRLKDSDETLKLLVRHLKQNDKDRKLDVSKSFKPSNHIERPNMPPPVPPRKLGKRHSFKNDSSVTSNLDGKLNTDVEQIKTNAPQVKNVKLFRKSSFDSHLYRQSKDLLKRSSPEEVRRLVRRLSDGKTMPPQAEVYMDLISQEWERCLALADGESDDTGSSICTVVDRLSSKASSVENSIPSTPIAQHKMIDLKRVLSCIENIDADLLSETLMDSQIKDNKATESPRLQDVRKNQKDIKREVPTITVKDSCLNIASNIQKNDKNNNNTIIKNVTCINIEDDSTEKVSPPKRPDNITAKPRPKPRQIKPENLKITNEIKKEDNKPMVEDLLTPTKKNCIETWLQRSEEELKDTKVEKFAPDPVEDILPRLIDFVPKPHFIVPETKICELSVIGNVSTVTSPTSDSSEKFNVVDTPREDGSGASLDTIGEDDESADVNNVEESAPCRKSRGPLLKKDTLRSYVWNGNGHKSDSEDKSLSNDEIPPSCPRQPPDGVETPNEIIEKLPETVHNIKSETKQKAPLLSMQFSTTPRPRFSYSRKQDDRSECSVKDKIAMFSNAASTDQVDKCGLLPMPMNNNVSVYSSTKKSDSSLSKRFTKSHENLLNDVSSNLKTEKRPEALGGFDKYHSLNRRETIAELPVQNKNGYTYSNGYNSNPSAKTVFKERIRSISVDNGTKSHAATLEMLIEQRKKSMSKLRGLVLPENHSPISDLPEIKVKENRSAAILLQSAKNPTPKLSRKQLNLKESLKNNLVPGNIPKYSPAFKRKSLQLFTIPAQTKDSTQEKYITRLDKPSRLSFENNKIFSRSNTGLLIRREFDAAIVGDKRTLEKLCNSNIYGSMEVKICTATEVLDSDNDSAVSSTQSSYRSSASSPLHTIDSVESDSSHLSPRSSQYVPFSLVKNDSKSINFQLIANKNDKNQVSRSMSSDTNLSASSSAGSGATSGSQASCSSLESTINDTIKRKVTRTHSIDSINRRNILASAKCRSGRDLNVSSPVAETKFIHETTEKSPSPQRHSAERLSTLTNNVSAMSNKGDSRRMRSKVIAASDSDSEVDLDLRTRKTDYKTSRSRKYATKIESAIPPKKVENNVNFDKVEDTPEVISERILKEIKQTGLIEKKPYTKTCKTSTEKIAHAKTENEKLSSSREFENKFNLTEVNNTSPSPQLPSKEEHKIAKVVKKSFEAKENTTRICLKRGNGAGVGLILAGGTDCEAKNVTIHKVLAGSAAEREGLTRGCKVISINGRSTEGLTHAESVTILKEPRPEVELIIESKVQESSADGASETTDSKECSLDSVGSIPESKATVEGDLVTVVLMKTGGGAGLGFGLDGGKDSPLGDRPLTIKKLFAGGAAARSGSVEVGAELISAGDVIMPGLTRTQAWARLKDLPEGPVTIVLKTQRKG